MYLDRISVLDPETSLIATDALARQQWEAVLADLDAPAAVSASSNRALSSWPQWLAARFEAAEASTDRPHLILSPGQTLWLWRRIIEASAPGQALIRSGGVARWARSARRNLLDHGVAPAEQGGAAWRDDSNVFLEWNRAFEAELERSGWVDPDSLLHRVNQSPVEVVAEHCVWLDIAHLTPEAERLVQIWQGAGYRVDRVEPDAHRASVDAVIAGDPAAEIRLAARWAADRLGGQPGCRLAIVIPDLERRRDEVEAVMNDHLGASNVTGLGGRPIAELAIFGAALTAIRLLGGAGGFEALSRWLRSPYFSSEDEGRMRLAARLEIDLRSEPGTARDFADAWSNLGLRSRFAANLPDTARRLDQALDRLPRRASPTAWTAAWQACLRMLGWQGFEQGLPARLQNAWDNAWARFAELTPILGPIERGTALDVLGEIVATESVYEPMALQGVVLTSRIGEVGPGFDGAWIAGFTDEAAAPADGPNPLLPWSVQARSGMPGASPERVLRDARDDLERLERRVPEARFSCPARIGDEPRLPSPLIDGWQRASDRPVATEARSGRIGARIGARRWLEQDDPAPPLEGEAIRGGTRTLDLQSACPARAFVAARLRAEPIEPPTRGVDGRLRGLLIHRVLERLLAPDAGGTPGMRLGIALDEAFGQLTRRGDAAWQAQLTAERRRIERIAERLLEADAARPSFTTVAVECRTEIVVDGHRLLGRLDRIDRMASGETLLIDYKTGQLPTLRWFEARLGDCQLPAYAIGELPAGIAAIRLDDGDIAYRWAGSLSLPGRGQSFDDAGWAAQIARWRTQIGELLDEFVAGDVRVPADAMENVAADSRDLPGGAFAPLTRIGDAR